MDVASGDATEGIAAGGGGGGLGRPWQGGELGHGGGDAEISDADLYRVERLCEAMYNSSDASTRAEAVAAASPFANSEANVPLCLALLRRSTDAYSQMFAATSLIKLINAHWTRLDPLTRLRVHNYVFSVLVERGPSLAPFVVTELCLLLCLATKLGWNDEQDVYRDTIERLVEFLSVSEAHCEIALEALHRLVVEMNQPSTVLRRAFSQALNRRVARSFRDLQLLEVFKSSLTTLSSLRQPPAHRSIRLRALLLAQACLSFDFIGTAVDETSEDLSTVHVPVSWRSFFEDGSTLRLLADTYSQTCSAQSDVSAATLECVVQLASVRRSLLTEERRRDFLEGHVGAMVDILRRSRGLEHGDNYHHFCRWLAQFRGNHELVELYGSNLYAEWLHLVTQFSVHCIAAPCSLVSNSLFYLLLFWNRMIKSGAKPPPSSGAGSAAQLDAIVAKIVEQYVSSRLSALDAACAEDADADGGDDGGEMAVLVELGEHIEHIPQLVRRQYNKSAEFLVRVFDPLLERYKSTAMKPPRRTSHDSARSGAAAADGAAPAAEVCATELYLCWLVRVIDAVVGGRSNSYSTEAQELTDGELSSRVFQLMMYSIERSANHSDFVGAPHARSRVELDSALVDFCQSFRRVYIGERAMTTSKVYVRLSERLALSDHMAVLDVIMSKVACNLREYGVDDGREVVRRSISLMADLAGGHSSSKLLGKLNTVRAMLSRGDEDAFAFLKSRAMGRERSSFSQTLTRVLFTLSSGGEIDSERSFEDFMRPLQARLQALAAVSTDEQLLNDEGVRGALIGAVRDLQGVVAATLLRRTYAMFFEWLHPMHTPLLLRAMRVYAAAGVNEVTMPILKFYAELVHNKPQRIVFDNSSPNGILLFRAASSILSTYGSATLANWSAAERSSASPPSTQQAYNALYKGASICLLILFRSLSGNYVNFGIFKLYGDTALSSAMEVCLQLALSIPKDELLAYAKIARAYYALMDHLCSSHPAELVAAGSEVFVHVVKTLRSGIAAPEQWMLSATALDHLNEYRFRLQMKDSALSRQLAAHVERNPQLFPSCLEVIFLLIADEDCANQWTLSRPLLSLILTNEDAYMDLKRRMIDSQGTADARHMVASAFEKLMQDVQPNLESKNRDRFTSNVASFRHALRSNA